MTNAHQTNEDLGFRAARKPMLSRRRLLAGGTLLLAWSLTGGRRHALAASPASNPLADPRFSKTLIQPPPDPVAHEEFRAALAAWRDDVRRALRFDDALYAKSAFTWASSCFAGGFVVLNDEAFLDRKAGRYKVDEFLDEAEREFGGYDTLLLWPAYPRIGVDDRNQFDYVRDLPGGMAGLRGVGRRCRARGVRIFIPYNPWDTGTRREAQSDVDALVALVGAIEADGIFLDTMRMGAVELRQKLDAARPGVVFEGALALPLERVHDHHMSWSQGPGFDDGEVPGVLRNKWVERRHMQHQIRRLEHDHTGELHTAWMNGSGTVIWENVFGNWVGWCARDKSLLRFMLPVQRRYAHLFAGEAWTPWAPTRQPRVHATLWEGGGLRLWTLINRDTQPVVGDLLSVPAVAGAHYFDLLSGREIKASADAREVTLTGGLGPRGIGAFVAGSSEALGRDFEAFLAAQRGLWARASSDPAFPALTTTLVPVSPTRRYVAPPEGMTAVPGGSLTLITEMRLRETGLYESQSAILGPGFKPAQHSLVTLERRVALARFAIDLAPVTNAQFKGFLGVSGYRPQHPEKFLAHWRNGSPPDGLDDHPVVYVSLDDARAYAQWAGRRLPTEDEWQVAAAGSDARRWPWGHDWQAGRCNGGERGGTTPVKAFPEGRSPHGCWDMCGNTWEWTESERSDGRNRFSMLKGGSYYAAKGSHWYTDGGPQPNPFALKLLLVWAGLDRFATVGFRCAADLDSNA